MRNHNLAGVAATTANMFVRVELAKAQIPAFHVERRCKREVLASVVGSMRFHNGLKVTFNRAWYYWEVKLSRPIKFEDACRLNESWKEQIRVDGFAGGTEPRQSGVSSYHVDSQAGLNTLVQFIAELNGTPAAWLPDSDNARERMITFQRFETETLDIHPGHTFCHPPATEHQTAELEIGALLLLGGSSERIIANHKDAINIAVEFFGADSTRAIKVRKELATVLRSQIAHKASYYSDSTDRRIIDSYFSGTQLHDVMTLRITLLKQVGRHKEARSVQASLDKISPRVADDIRRYLSDELKLLKDCKRNEPKNSGRLALIHYHCAYGFWKLAMVQRSLGNCVDADLHLAQSEQFAEKLDPESIAHYQKCTKAA
jgi:hypothetical protein